ncbi:MAG: sensory box histidine kinase [Myxococcaceae bacterium]|nr:sensory box histidine kinase [Myxococcaceae bacterium]
MPPDKKFKTTEERLARLSVLQELTVAALDLFDPDSRADTFLERVAERLGCLAVVWLTFGPAEGASLLGAAGLSEASRALPIPAPPSVEKEPLTLALPFPEVSRPGMTRWHFHLHEATASSPSHALFLWFDAQLTPPDEYLPAVERLVGVLRTVLAHRQLAGDLKRSYAELTRAQIALVERERLAALGELAAVVAHEVRNPLAVIFNCIATMEKGPGAGEPILEILGEEANRLNQIVSELLDFARPGRVLLQSESLEDIVAGAIAAVRSAQVPSAPAVDIELAVARPLEPLLVDFQLVRRAVINLVGNAVQALPSGGRIVVRVIDEVKPARGVRIEVSDNGPGIPQATLDRIFEPFFTTKASGTGLGLAIVKRAAEAHSGELTVRSEEGRGTTFVMRLPASTS